ncbi:C1 family peptidase [Mycoplasma struthionis]|uniref:C1 family peptidase n=1 Tax=Mycoplasma struthionis TaxID=538220 RepID=UPI0021BD7D94|nr:C1 family peptidase [Mycoplasma struthionis]
MNNIDEKLLEKFEKNYDSKLENKVIENAIFKNGIKATSTVNEVVKKHNYQFSVEVNTPSVTNQKSSGRCWIFAALNSVRIKLMKELNLEALELSQNFLHFYDKLEKANVYLTWIYEKGLELDNEDRLFRHFNANPISDGGYWEFFTGLIKKIWNCSKRNNEWIIPQWSNKRHGYSN